MMERLLKILPGGLTRRLAKGAVPLVVAVVLVILLAGLAVAALVSPGALGISAARIAETRELPDTFQSAGLNAKDADHDGLPDALENYLYGTDAGNWNSSGLSIPDGWLAQHGYDPLSPVTKTARGAAPPADVLAQHPAYQQGYPDAYRPPLSAYYAYGKPAGYQPGVDAPWWVGQATVDPTQWDQAGTGVPTGWLLHYGLDPLHPNVDAVAPGSKGNLTVRQAFDANVDPLALDTDQDGLSDWMEIHVTHTDPAKFSTAGTGVADGWLLHYGLNAFDPSAGSQDPDRDGLTNLEEFVYGYDLLRADVQAKGIDVLFAKGLDPTQWETANTGIPDGWYVKYGLSPFGEDVDRVIANASDWPQVRDLPASPPSGPLSHCTEVAASPPAPGQPIPDCVMTIQDAYLYGRPSSWNESVEGVWWGGTDPATGDTDHDGVPDAVEIRGWNANATLDTGPDAKAHAYRARSNPLESDSDADGLTDLEEYAGKTTCGASDAPTRSFPPTDPLNRDTAFSGLSDFEKVCGVVRGDSKYDLGAAAPGQPFLDPTRADSAGDLMKDGPRLQFWADRYDQYRASPVYPYNGSAYKTLFDWTRLYQRFSGLSQQQVVDELRPDGDVDGDGIPNVLDSDPSGGLFAEKQGASVPKTKVFFPAGPKMDPSLYKLTEFASSVPRPGSDPANPDTDGDGLPDSWEIRYGGFDASIHVGGQQGGWNLDPSRADSDGNGVTDDKENLDGDVVAWYSYDSHAGAARMAHQFSFSVVDEYLAGTDPNKLSTAGDGVSDGWKAFWGSRIDPGTFPSLLAANDPRVGDSIIGGDPAAQARRHEVETAMATSPIQPLAKLSCDGGGCKETGYVRFVCSAQAPESVSIPCSPMPAGTANDRCAALATLARPDPLTEKIDGSPAGCFEGDTLKGVAVKVLSVDGVYRLSYADQQRLRVNPFLADSDGDGAPDAYEAYMLQQAKLRSPNAAFPDPANPETGDRADPDKDGLSLSDECHAASGQCSILTFTLPDASGLPHAYGAGSDPNLADTDGDGVEDGIEVSAGTVSPLVPKDVDDFRNGNKDSDHDGVPDFLELTGFGKTQFNFDENVKTDPQRADTDGDGLLDGPDRFSTQVGPDVTAQWNASGIAHKTLSNGTVEFYGEGAFHSTCGCVPTTLDSSGTGIPDGWYAYYLRNPSEGAAPTAAYQAGRPAWWDETKDGVWWWGTSPDAGAAPVDADNDGLHDRNGEDPFPSLFNNTVAGRFGDPKEAQAWVQAAATPDETRLRAQSWGDSPGEPAFGRSQAHVDPASGLAVSRLRVPTRLLNVSLGSSSVVTKGQAFNVTGVLVLRDSTGADRPAANRTVLVSAFGADPAAIVGAGFTAANGSFRIVANLTADQTVAIPAPGLTLLGATQGAVSLPFDPSRVATGAATAGAPNALVVWVYNTSATAGVSSPTYLTATATVSGASTPVHATAFAASAPLPIVVHSATRLDTTVAGVVENGGTLQGDLRLTDAGGGALEEPVTFTWNGAPTAITQRATTDRSGHLNLTSLHVPISARQPGRYILSARFDSTDANLTSVAREFAIDVRSPTAIQAALSAPGGTVGDLVSVAGTLSTAEVTLVDGSVVSGTPVPNAPVRILLGGLDQTATTDATGRFNLSFPIPGSLSAGPQSVQARFAGDAVSSPSEIDLPLAVKRTSEIVDLTSLTGPRSLDTTLRGRLVDNEGDGILGQVVATGEKGRLGFAQTDDSGAFAIAVPLNALPLGTSTVNVTYAGDRDHGDTSNLTTATVTSATTLTLGPTPFSLVRGGAFSVSATVLDDAGAPVARQAVAVSWRGEKQGTAVTDDTGNLTFLVQTNRTERASLGQVALVYAPRSNSLYQGSSASASVAVLQGSTLRLDPQRATRGLVAASGVLLDDEGHPIPAAAVRVRVGGADLGEARTARNGSFLLQRPLPAGFALGPVNATASYPGTDAIAGANATAPWSVRSPLTLELASLAPLVRGEPAALAGTLADDQGAPVDATLTASLAGLDLGKLPVHAGRVAGTLSVPADAPRGASTLWLNASGDARYDALSVPLDVVVKVRPKVDVHLPALAVRGFSVAGDITLLDDKGQPLRNTTFVYALGKGSAPVVGQTDVAGKATLASVTPLTGDAAFAITVRGGSDVLGTEYRSQAIAVVGPGTPVAYAGLILLVLVALVLVAGVIAVAMLRRRQLGEAREILQEAIQELLAGNEYQGTIFLAYRRFSAHLARYGYAEKESETPREFAAGVRKALPVGAVAMRELIRLFEEARYSDHAIGSEERDRAVESLAAVRNELDALLGRKAAAPSPGVGA